MERAQTQEEGARDRDERIGVGMVLL